MQKFRAYLFDLDGTLYRGTQPLPFAAEVVGSLRSNGARIAFLTNNSGTTPHAVAEKLTKMGIEAHPDEVVTSGMAAAAHLHRRQLGRVFAVGEPGLVEVLRARNVEVANADSDGFVTPEERGPYDAVVCGICRFFSYDLLNAAFQALRGGAEFVATNPDPTYPMENRRLEPGAGCLVAALQTCSGVQPYIAGKPQPDMIRIALEAMGLAPEDALVVGDRLDTDIAAADAAGCPSVLVLGGVTEESKGVETISDLRGLL